MSLKNINLFTKKNIAVQSKKKIAPIDKDKASAYAEYTKDMTQEEKDSFGMCLSANQTSFEEFIRGKKLREERAKEECKKVKVEKKIENPCLFCGMEKSWEEWLYREEPEYCSTCIIMHGMPAPGQLMQFGKYKDKCTAKEVFEKDRRYAKWCMENVPACPWYFRYAFGEREWPVHDVKPIEQQIEDKEDEPEEVMRRCVGCGEEKHPFFMEGNCCTTCLSPGMQAYRRYC